MPLPRQLLAKATFFVAALPTVIRTARRVARLKRELPIDRLVAKLRGGEGRPLPRRLAHPAWLAGTVERVLPWLPPKALGPCLRRALILVDLWSRAGLEPRLHIGLKPAAGLRDAHAWITAVGPTGGELQVSAPLDFQEAFVF